MNIYEIINKIQTRYLTVAAECGASTKWSDEFIVKEIRDMFDNNLSLMDRMQIPLITKNDLLTLTVPELEQSGFRRWDSDVNWLVPLYLLNFLKQDDEYTCINNSTTLVKDFDTDHRAGLLAYYFTLTNEVKVIECP